MHCCCIKYNNRYDRFLTDIYTFLSQQLSDVIARNNEQVSFSLKEESYRLIVPTDDDDGAVTLQLHQVKIKKTIPSVSVHTKKEGKALVCHSLILSFTLTFELNEHAFPSRL